jgi:hypothetical protein
VLAVVVGQLVIGEPPQDAGLEGRRQVRGVDRCGFAFRLPLADLESLDGEVRAGRACVAGVTTDRTETSIPAASIASTRPWPMSSSRAWLSLMVSLGQYRDLNIWRANSATRC